MMQKKDRLSTKIGLKIRLERIKRGMSQEKLAELSDISMNYVGLIERGASSPTIDMLNQIANGFGIKLVDLINIENVEL